MTTLHLFRVMVLDDYMDEKPRDKQELPTYTSVGSYPLVYFTKGGDTLCSDCATKELWAWRDNESYDPPIDYDMYAEGPDLYCDDCGKPIASAYGDPDNPDDTTTEETDNG